MESITKTQRLFFVLNAFICLSIALVSIDALLYAYNLIDLLFMTIGLTGAGICLRYTLLHLKLKTKFKYVMRLFIIIAKFILLLISLGCLFIALVGISSLSKHPDLSEIGIIVFSLSGGVFGVNYSLSD